MKLTAAEMLFAEAGSLEERFILCRACGFDGIDIRDNIERVEEILRLKDRHELDVGMVYSALPLPLLSKTVHQRAAALEILKSRIVNAKAIGAYGVIVVPVFGPPRFGGRPSGVEERERTVLEVMLAELEPCLETTGVRLLIEPLNREETHLFCSPSQTAEYVRRLHLRGVETMADTYHMQKENQDVGRELREAADCLGHIHLSGPARSLPEAGRMDVSHVMGVLRSIGFKQMAGLECRPSATADIRDSVRFVRACLEQS